VNRNESYNDQRDIISNTSSLGHIASILLTLKMMVGEFQGAGYGGMQKFNVGNVCDGFPKSTRHLPSNSEWQRSLFQCSDGIYTVEARISVGGITGLANYVIVSTRRGWCCLHTCRLWASGLLFLVVLSSNSVNMADEDNAVRRREAANDDSSDKTEHDSNAKNGEAGDGSDQEKQNEGPAT
jgi:hypothetical protein